MSKETFEEITALKDAVALLRKEASNLEERANNIYWKASKLEDKLDALQWAEKEKKFAHYMDGRAA